MKKLYLILFSLIFFSGCTKLESSSPISYADHQLVMASVGKENNLELEVVNTPASITQGLSDRDELGSDGMLFVFNTPRQVSFWMKDMKFDLDLVWIRDSKIIGITSNVPAPKPNTNLSSLPSYIPPDLVDMVLEVPAGFALARNLQVGDEILIK